MCPNNYPRIKLELNLEREEGKIEHLSSYAYIFVHTTAKQVISSHGKNENARKMSKNEKCRFKACKRFFLHCQICKFVKFLLPLLSELLKLPTINNSIGNGI